MTLIRSLVVVAALAGAASVPAIALAGEEGCGGCKNGGTVADKVEIKFVTTEELAKLVAAKEKKAIIVDVNGTERYAKGHVPGARFAAKDALTEKELGADKAAMLVFYCGSEKCPASTVAAKNAIAMGYTNVYVYKGGIAGWEAAKQAVETGAPAGATPS